MGKPTWTVLTAGCAITLATGLAAQPAQAAGPAETGPAATTISALTSGGPAAAAATLPTDFAEVTGYRPVLRDGMLVKPNGDCSSPVPLPREFDTACQGHDLGYDLLRYADRSGERLGPWARRALDLQLDERLHAACATRPDDVTRASCGVVASTAAAAVDTNSWRQQYAAPRPEPVAAYAAAGAGILLLAAAVVAQRGRNSGRDRSEEVVTQVVPA
ncbi:conserved exported hypothetical protein [Rhodococcus sp. RD6.2]|jgi:hypothetical protein|uniref:hypothetical protein n=1 Tax=Rhodococcus sp. RD6.2 TaxID=260936 RepID=UPI00063B81E0|nr:hypothetical protein [Rhodococcus sp. RD6.2]CRK54103.1 conserved exported hypothetical protein [Rhodococcus sp. RD6.2]